MKIDRLIGILAILLQQEKVTAPFLADRFEVSRRTINRDIEALCKAGIPVATSRGPDGGISIMEGYRVDRALLTCGEMQAILDGLNSLDSISDSSRYRQLMDKLAVGKADVIHSDSHVFINLSSWYRESLAPKIHQIQEAAEHLRLVSFTYFSPSGETNRVIEPYMLVFQWSSWYVWGYCRLREALRMFKLNRMTDVRLLDETFKKRDVPPMEHEPDGPFPVSFFVKAVCHPSIKWKIVDEFGAEALEELPDKRILLQTGYTNKEHLISWILSMGDRIELLEPAEFRRELEEISRRMAGIYKEAEDCATDETLKN